METAREINNKPWAKPALTWNTCPPEIIILIINNLPPASLFTCMFINSKWRKLVFYIINHNKIWTKVIESVLLCKEDFYIRSKDSMDLGQIFTNYVLWNSLPRSNIGLHRVHKVIETKVTSMYRDNLIVVANDMVLYYKVDTFELLKIVTILSCRDFKENDHMLLVIVEEDGFCVLKLYEKLHKNDFNMTHSNEVVFNKVLRYKIINDRCYLIDHLNNLHVLCITHEIPGQNLSNWTDVFYGRYYGPPNRLNFLNVFRNDISIMLTNGSFLVVNETLRNFQKFINVPVPQLERTGSVFCKMFHKFCFVFGVPASETFFFDRYSLMGNTIFWFRCPGLSCAIQHNEVLIFGYINGMIEFFMPRLLETKGPLRRFNLKDLKADVVDVAVVSIEVHEDHGFHHLVIATSTEIFHLHITYKKSASYMWNKFPKMMNW